MSSHISLLSKGCEELGIELSGEQIDQFDKYMQLLLEWNKKFNLTAIKEADENVINHFLDSLSVLKAGLVEDDCNMLDLGTGAGFPGIPLRIAMPGVNITLVDAVNKKVTFLAEVIKELRLDNTIALHGRAEELAKQKNMRESYDIVVSRAVAELKVLLEYTIPFVRVGGYSIFNKGPGAKAELKDSKRAADILGAHTPKQKRVFVPFSERTHNLVITKKVKHTPEKYPRSPGRPKRSPL